MPQHPEHEVPIGRGATYVKWLIFGVLLPLLPFVARWLAAWIDNASANFSLISLLSDGELLVVATVIAAAVIGDLLFDFSKLNAARGRATRALICALSLLVVIISVLMFGLVTLDNQHRSDAVLKAEHERNSAPIELLVQSVGIRKQYGNLSNEETGINAELNKLLHKYSAELSRGRVVSRESLRIIDDLGDRSSKVTKELQSLNNQGEVITSEIAQSRQRRADILVRAVNNLNAGRKQAAYMSLAMFGAAVLIGFVAIWVSTTRSSGQRKSDRQRNDLASPTAEKGHQKLNSSQD